MALATYFCRVFAFTVVRHPIENRFFQSFLYYVPYVTLAVMTFPAIVEATQSPLAGIGALVVGIIVAWIGGNPGTSHIKRDTEITKYCDLGVFCLSPGVQPGLFI